MNFNFVGKSRYTMLISIVIIAAGLIAVIMGNLNLGIDFTGGTLIQIDIGQSFTDDEVREALKPLGLDGSKIQRVRTDGSQPAEEVVIRTHTLDETERRQVIEALQTRWPQITEESVLRAYDVGAVIGSELTRSALLALGLAAVGMIIYITIRFEFGFAVTAIIALLHDALIVISIFAVLGIEINSPFIAAILTIIGYSVNDTIVIYDRIRENLKIKKRQDIVSVVNRSLSDTLTRTINTSMTTLAVLVVLMLAFYFFVGATDLQAFVTALLIGVVSGTYSSLFIAPPLWVAWKKRKA